MKPFRDNAGGRKLRHQKESRIRSHNEHNAEREFRQALQRVTLRAEESAEWFFEFCRKDLNLLSKEQREELWHDLLALSIVATRPNVDSLKGPLTPEERRQWQWAALWPRYPWDRKRPQDASFEHRNWWQEILNIQKKVDAAIAGILAQGRVLISLEHVAFEIGSGVMIPVFPLAAWTSVKDGTDFTGPEGAVLIRLVQVVNATGSRFHRCESGKCSKIFIMRRYMQKYCTNTCRSRVAMQNFRRAQHEKTTRIRQRHMKIVLRKGGTSHGKKGR